VDEYQAVNDHRLQRLSKTFSTQIGMVADSLDIRWPRLDRAAAILIHDIRLSNYSATPPKIIRQIQVGNTFHL
jgi:hypothetical protein